MTARKPGVLAKVETVFFAEPPWRWEAVCDCNGDWVVKSELDLPVKFLHTLDLMSVAVCECMHCDSPIGRKLPLGMFMDFIPFGLTRVDGGVVAAECANCMPGFEVAS